MGAATPRLPHRDEALAVHLKPLDIFPGALGHGHAGAGHVKDQILAVGKGLLEMFTWMRTTLVLQANRRRALF
jgi:hypothetical protein